MSSRTSKLIPIGILVGAFVVRLVFLLQIRNLPFYYNPILDSDFFHGWAGFKQQAGWLDASAPFREPFYTYVLGLIYSVFRESQTIARLVQCLMGAFTALLIYATARRIYGLTAAVSAGVIFALYGPALFFSSEINETTLAVFLLAVSAYLLVKAASTKPFINTGLSGLFLGMAFLTRFSVIGAVAAWVLHLLFSRDRKLKRATLGLAIGLALPLVCYQVFLVRGTERTLLPTRIGWQAFLGSGVTGGTAKLPEYEITLGGAQGAFNAFVASDRIEGQRDSQRFAKIETGIDVSQVEAHKHWRRRAVEDFLSDPGRYLTTYVRKLGIFFGPSEPPANMDLRFVSRYSFLLRWRIFSFAVIAPLGLIGLAVCARRQAIFAAVAIPLFAVVVATCLISDAEKLMIVPLLSIPAGGLVGAVVAALKKPRIVKAAAYIIVVVIAGLLLYQLPRHEMDEARQLVVLGDVYGEEAIFEKAEESYKEAIRLSPGMTRAYVSLAGLYGNSGRAEQGIEMLTAAINSGLDDPRLRIEKASLLTMAARPDEALSELEGLENSHPYEPRLHQLKGLDLLARGEIESAISELKSEIDYVGGGFITYSALGRANLDLGNYVEAGDYLEQALGLNPYSTNVAMELADSYTGLGQHYKACDVLSRVLGVDPGNIPLRFKLANCCYRAGSMDDALKHFKELNKFDPGNSDVVLNIGTVYAEMDSLDRAVEMWQRALALDPDNQMAKENLRTAREGHE
ncbi:MAG: tetratricopeptide repeat protein [Candidatus Eisenbacteria bacterium]